MIKLYEKKSYLKECKARVIFCERRGEKVCIKLDETIFFPNEGGQYADTGVLEYTTDAGQTECVNLTDGNIEDNDIIYTVDKEIKVGAEVLCRLDWNTRFSRMQNHSGEHILSGLIHNKYGFNNIGFHLSDDDFVTLNMDGMLTKSQVSELEEEVNRIICQDVPIIDLYPSKEELAGIQYRSKIEIDGQVRLIRIGEEDNMIDMCACCAPHVKRTGEIGILKVTGIAKAKGGVLISILCGKRAVEYINHNLELLNNMATSFSTHPDNVPSLVEKLKNECMELKSEISALREEGIIREIIADEKIRCVFVSNDFSMQNVKNIYNALVKYRTGYVGVFAGSDETGYRYNVGGKDMDAKVLSKKMAEELLAKGGGSSEMAQGKTDSKKNVIEGFFDKL